MLLELQTDENNSEIEDEVYYKFRFSNDDQNIDSANVVILLRCLPSEQTSSIATIDKTTI